MDNPLRDGRPRIQTGPGRRARLQSRGSYPGRQTRQVPALRSKDVLHNYTVAQFRVKMDLIPGMQTYPVVYTHGAGSFRSTVRRALRHRPSYDARRRRRRRAKLTSRPGWPATRRTRTRSTARPVTQQLGKAQYGVCAACHGQNGEGLPLHSMRPSSPARASGTYASIMNSCLSRTASVASTKTTYLRRSRWHWHGQYARRRTRRSATSSRTFETFPDDPCAANGRRRCRQRRATCTGYAPTATAADGMPVCRHERTAHGRHDRLVPRAPDAEFQGRRSRDRTRTTSTACRWDFMGRTLQDDQAINDLVAYINSLSRSLTGWPTFQSPIAITKSNITIRRRS